MNLESTILNSIFPFTLQDSMLNMLLKPNLGNLCKVYSYLVFLWIEQMVMQTISTPNLLFEISNLQLLVQTLQIPNIRNMQIE